MWRDDGRGPVAAAFEPIQWLLAHEVPLVLVSCRPAAQVLDFQRELGLRHPFVCERGKRLFVPNGYFPELAHLGTVHDGWDVVEFGPQDPCAAVWMLASLYRLCASEVAFVGLTGEHHEATQLSPLPGECLNVIHRPEAWSEAILGPRLE
jgi:hydroxymethylpyrimidine pyrophosphatase-like HAD family hydrolase